ncbi:MAG: PRC-barrel domain-containing protein [Candidatus Hydrogenedentes bacterium]|nr:PRC-barrel domain-containing protein [Candidatus Hydrogenedentota bacterium]
MTARRTDIGVVRSVSPARREIRVTPLAGAEHLFDRLGLVEVVLADKVVLRCRIQEVRDETGCKILTLTPGVPRETVARMKGARLVAAAEPAAAEATYQFEDLDGLTVLDKTGSVIGTVTSLYSAGGNDAIEITRPGGGTILLPAVDQVIAAVNVDRGEMVVNDIAPYAVEED